MSDEQNNINENEEFENDIPQPDELTMLKQRATLMGVKFSNNIGVDALRQRIEDKLSGEQSANDSEASVEEDQDQPRLSNEPPVGDTAPVVVEPKKETMVEFRARVRKEANKLIRCRITCLDPKKANLPGEILTVANEYIGTVRKYVPYGEKTDNGWHIPQVIYNMLVGRKFLQIKQIKGQNGKPDTQEWAHVREFAIEVLPQLTPAELAKLAATQAAAGGVGD